MVERDLARRIGHELPGWRIEGKELVARWRLRDFAATLAATVRVGALAERADHHPEMRLGWGFLEVRLTTHKEGALTTSDIELALEIQEALGAPTP